MNVGDRVTEYLSTRELCAASRTAYASVLRSLNAFVQAQRVEPAEITGETLRAWLLGQRQHALRRIMYRVYIVAPYLAWRYRVHGESNPLNELTAHYGRRLTPIVRALLEEDPRPALERLRPLPEYGSVLGALIREHVARMRSLGCRYDTKQRELRRLDRFVQKRPDLVGAPLPKILEAWRHDAPGARHQLRVQQCGRALTQALHRHDATTAVVTIDAGLQRRVLREERKPYLFSEAEIDRLLAAARSYPSPEAPLRPVALHAMITLAYCAGLRLGEIVALTVGDVDLETGLLEIRDSKFFKSRRLPIASSVRAVLANYLDRRRETGAPPMPESALWWTPVQRQPYGYATIAGLLRSVMHHAGLKKEPGRCGPRVHDLRHTFVAHRMLQWYRSGIDPQARLPHLATYLGHKDIQSTLVYLTITPDLLQEAGERYRRHGVGALDSVGGRP